MKLWLTLLVGLALLPTGARGRPRPARIEVPLLVRVARCGGKPVKPDAWVRAHVAAANRILEPHGVSLSAAVEPFTPERCELTSRAHRDALAAHAAASGKVVVLVVQRARDLDVPSYNLMGVHWRYGGDDPRYSGRRWVILTARARPPVLAHELCHYLGLRHDAAGGNLMAPGPSDPIWRREGKKPAPWAPTLTARQARRVQAAARSLVGVEKKRKGGVSGGKPPARTDTRRAPSRR